MRGVRRHTAGDPQAERGSKPRSLAQIGRCRCTGSHMCDPEMSRMRLIYRWAHAPTGGLAHVPDRTASRARTCAPPAGDCRGSRLLEPGGMAGDEACGGGHVARPADPDSASATVSKRLPSTTMKACSELA